MAPHKVNTCLKANTIFECKVRAKECPPPRFPNPLSPFKDGGGDPAPCAGQMRVMADTRVNIQLKINRLDNYYMLLVPINLIAVSPLLLRGRKTQSIVSCGEFSGRSFVPPLPPTDGADARNPLRLCRGPVSGRSPASRAIKELVGHAPCCKIYASLC